MQKQNWTRIENLENHHKAHKKSKKKVKVLDSLPLLPPSPIFFSVFFFKYFDKTPPRLPEYIVSLLSFVSWMNLEELLFIP